MSLIELSDGAVWELYFWTAYEWRYNVLATSAVLVESLDSSAA